MNFIAKNTDLIKKLVTFTPQEWNFIQNYKHANRLQADMEAIKAFIHKEMKRTEDIILASIERSAGILKKLADR